MKKIIALFFILMLVAMVYQCNSPQHSNPQIDVEQTYLNWHDTVKYVGIETCKTCHADKWKTFIHTGMGSSFGLADTLKSIAKISGHQSIYDKNLDYYYRPYWKNKTLYVEEYRLGKNGDTLYSYHQAIDYVVGSGQHTNSHMYQKNGYIYQAPFTWYAQKSTLDLPPGYENGANARFNRIIGLECMSCHNAMPTSFVLGSENKFDHIPLGIDCERCHGPGQAHVQKMESGNITDTSGGVIDYSIVNPKKLSVALQFELCQRCHLQGNAVLAEEKSFFDFKPGMVLSEVMDVYLPRYSGNDEQFIMASHVDRFKQSKCFSMSEGYTCTSCHNPHISVKKTDIEVFNNQCKSCHQTSKPTFECTEDVQKLKANNFNCVKCHMPSSGAADIPHVSVHDHWVQKPSIVKDTSGISKFLGLYAINNKKPSKRSKITAYLQQYESFKQRSFYLDSAYSFLKKYDGTQQNSDLWIRYFYLKKDYKTIVQWVQSKGEKKVLKSLKNKSFDNNHAWQAYRIGEAYSENSLVQPSITFYKKAVDLAPFVISFRNKYATALLKNKNYKEAKIQFEKVLLDRPSHKESLNNLGYIYMLEGDFTFAQVYIDKALQKDPDYELAWLNKANICMQQQDSQTLKKALEQVLRINPENKQARELYKTL